MAFNQNVVFMLTAYEYDTYSYSGIEVRETWLFMTEEGAKAFAGDLGLKVVDVVERPGWEATIEAVLVRP